jgi:hypothetical protein
MGRGAASCPESKILHISERRIPDTNQSTCIAILELLQTDHSQEYEAIYKASLAVAAYPVADRVVSRRKRTDEDDEDNFNRYVLHSVFFSSTLTDSIVQGG